MSRRGQTTGLAPLLSAVGGGFRTWDQPVSSNLPTHHDVILWPGDRGQDVDAVGGEVPSLFGPVVDAMRPARVHHMLAVVLVQDDQVSLRETQEGGVYPSCILKIHKVCGSFL